MIQTDLLNQEVKTNGICDNTDCENPIRKTTEITLIDDFNNDICHWCESCIERDEAMILKCPNCDKLVAEYELSNVAFYHPFDIEPSFEGKMCDRCYNDSDVCFCESCLREIYYNNGYRANVRFHKELDTMICAFCLQNEWFVEGMPFFKDADWFDDSDLREHGFNKHGSYFCRSSESYENVKGYFYDLQNLGYLAIVSIEASGMGLEHHISLWYKEVVD